MALSGTLPPELSSMASSLSSIVVVNSPLLVGAIPDAWASLTELRVLHLEGVGINGSLPAWLPPQLDTLVLARCGFLANTMMPSNWSSLQQLTTLVIDIPPLQGGPFPLPSTMRVLSLNEVGQNVLPIFPNAIRMMINLTVLNLSRTSVQLPDWIGELHALATIDVSSNYATTSWTLPESMSQLQSLRTLDVSLCPLRSMLPDWIGSLKSLTTLSARSATQYFSFFPPHAQFVVPQTLGQLTSLVHLDISNNNISGTFLGVAPAKNLTKLKWLDLSSSQMQGGLPPSIWLLSELRRLSVENNKLFGGLEGVGQLQQLRTLVVTQNLLNGTLSEYICSLQFLEVLQLSYNQLRSTIPLCIGSLHSLATFDASWNALSGELPQSLGSLRSLEFLRLDGNMLSGALPESLSLVGNITNIMLSDNNFTGTIPLAWTALNRLSYLIISRNRLTGSLPQGLLSMPSLLTLDLSQNQLSGTFPSIGRNNSLYTLLLSSNLLRGPLPSDLGSLKRVMYFDVSLNTLNGTFPVGVGQWSNSVGLNVSWNFIEGEPPSDFWTFGQYRGLGSSGSLDCRGNRLSGNLSALGSLTCSTVLLGSNQFTGPLPKALHPSLTVLDVSNNQLSGSLDPATLSTLGHLATVDASNNSLSGSLGAWMRASSLNTLNVSRNRLSGTLPSVLPSQLQVLDLSHNLLGGTLPASWGTSLGCALQRLCLDGLRFCSPPPNGWIVCPALSESLNVTSFEDCKRPIFTSLTISTSSSASMGASLDMSLTLSIEHAGDKNASMSTSFSFLAWSSSGSELSKTVAPHTSSDTRPVSSSATVEVPRHVSMSLMSVAAAGVASTAAAIAVVVETLSQGGAASFESVSLAAVQASPCLSNNGDAKAAMSRSPLRFVASPFYDLGDEFVVFGNIGTAGLFYLCPPIITAAHSAWRGESAAGALSARLRFPSVANTIASLLTPGCLIAATRLAAFPSDAVAVCAVAAAALCFAALVVSQWRLVTLAVLPVAVLDALPQAKMAPCCSSGRSLLLRALPLMRWSPPELRAQYGSYFNGMKDLGVVRFQGAPLFVACLFCVAAAIPLPPSDAWCATQASVLILLQCSLVCGCIKLRPFRSPLNTPLSASASVFLALVVAAQHVSSEAAGLFSLFQSIISLSRTLYNVAVIAYERSVSSNSSCGPSSGGGEVESLFDKSVNDAESLPALQDLCPPSGRAVMRCSLRSFHRSDIEPISQLAALLTLIVACRQQPHSRSND